MKAMEKYYRDEGKDDAYIRKYLRNRVSKDQKRLIISRDVKKYRMRREFGFKNRDVNLLLKGNIDDKVKRLNIMRKKMDDDKAFRKIFVQLGNPKYGTILSKATKRAYWAQDPKPNTLSKAK